MKLNTSLEKFKKLHKKKQNQIICFSQDCRNYVFIENLYKFILIKKLFLYLNRLKRERSEEDTQ